MTFETSHYGHDVVNTHEVKGLKYCITCKAHFFPFARFTNEQINSQLAKVVHSRKLKRWAVAALLLTSCICGVATALLLDWAFYTRP